LIHWILSQMEENPNAVFYGRELEERFPDSVESSVKGKLIVRISPESGSYSYGLSSQYRIVESEDGFEAIDEDDPEAEPIHLSNDDLARYKLDLVSFARRVQQANTLTGTPSKITDRLFFLGEADVKDELTACILAFINAAPITHQVLSVLPSLLPTTYKRSLVVCPSHLPDLIERRQLEALHIRAIQLQKDNPFILPSFNNVLDNHPAEDSEFWHSEDYRSIRWHSQAFSLKPQEAEVVRILHQAHRVRTLGLKWDQIQTRLNSIQMYPQRMRDIFKNSPLWHNLIIDAGRGIYRINL
jgi:hypothetical protein